MKNLRLQACVLSLCALACAAGEDGSKSTDKDLESYLQAGEMTLELDGTAHDIELEVLDIYLVEDEDRYPEIFHFRGSDIELGGEFPMALHVGYEEAIERMEGQEVAIEQLVDLGSYGTIRAHVVLDGREWPVTGGTLRFTRHVGDPIDAGEVIEGRADLVLANGRKATGTFTVLAKTWG